MQVNISFYQLMSSPQPTDTQYTAVQVNTYRIEREIYEEASLITLCVNKTPTVKGTRWSSIGLVLKGTQWSHNGPVLKCVWPIPLKKKYFVGSYWRRIRN